MSDPSVPESTSQADELDKLPNLANLESLTLMTPRELPAMPKLTQLRVMLNIGSAGMRATMDLAFASKAPNLTSFEASGAKAADLTPVLALKQIEILNLAGICVVDAKSVTKLPKLKWMAVSFAIDDKQLPRRYAIEIIRSSPNGQCDAPPPNTKQ